MSSSPRDGLGERLAERVHENWANERRRQGWQPGPKRNDDLKQHPSLIPYEELSADEKKVDLAVSQGVLDALGELGLRVVPHSFDTFREYEFIAASTQFLTERRQAAALTYLTVNTAIFGVIGFLIEKTSQTAVSLALSSVPLIAVGAISCVVWWRALQHYRTLIGWRYDQLMAIEKSEAMSGSRQLYTREWEHRDPRVDRKGFPFSALEAALPKLFMALYVAYAIGLALNIRGWKF